ncbi:MAG: acyl-CoA thioesterase [Rhodospirillaceae bacterium]|nr:acyl-CoA thioesterase [Rhodospirillaceae bacterium]
MNRMAGPDTLAAVRMTDPRTYRFWSADRVQPADVDGGGRVQGGAIAVYFEGARVALFDEARLLEDGAAMTTAVASLTIDCLGEIRYPADLKIGSRIVEVDPMAVRHVQAIFCGGTCVATADTVSVLVDESGRQTAQLSEAQKARLLPFS